MLYGIPQAIASSGWMLIYMWVYFNPFIQLYHFIGSSQDMLGPGAGLGVHSQAQLLCSSALLPLPPNLRP